MENTKELGRLTNGEFFAIVFNSICLGLLWDVSPSWAFGIFAFIVITVLKGIVKNL